MANPPPNEMRSAHAADAGEGQRRVWGTHDWCTVLSAHFFGPHAEGLPVLLFVDEALLATLHPSHDEGAAVGSLTRAVRRMLVHGRPSGCFGEYQRRGMRWKAAGGEGPPPFLDLLAVCVLAATRMGTGGLAANDYRSHLCRLLAVDQAELADGIDSLDPLWNQLTWWLDERNGGRLGISTIVGDEHFTHIGYPISQTLFRGADVPKVEELFRWISLEPGEPVDDDVLLAYFRAWAPGKGLSPGAIRMASEPQLSKPMMRILDAYARRWDGTSSGVGGRRRGTLRVVVRRSHGVAISLEALQPEGFPSSLTGHARGRAAAVEAEDGIFAFTGPVGASMLLNGVRVAADDCELVLEGAPVHVLQLDAALGGWASVEAIAPGTRHWLLVAPHVRGDVLRQLERTADSVGTNEQLGDPLPGWTLVRDLTFRHAVSLSGALAARSPTERHRMSLRSGLRLSKPPAYLAGGAPDLWLPATPDERSSGVMLDGRPVPTSGAEIRLAEHLDAGACGEHVVEWSGLRRTFTLVPSVLRVPPDELPLAHALELDNGHVVAHRAVSIERGTGVAVRGAVATGHVAPPRPPAVLIRRDAQRAWLLGARAGEVHETSAPPLPPWLTRVGLFGRLYEERAAFTVAWVVEEWPHEPHLHVRPAAGLAPLADAGAEPRCRELWSRLLREATLTSAGDEAAQQRLGAYRALAAPLQEAM
jgi:hypothetical protein